jgi:antitoxin component YwqK of YwqJK toxin-antitoxin module
MSLTLLRYFIFYILFFISNKIKAQDTLVKYLDHNLEITSNIENASFVAKVTKKESGYDAKIYYGNENLAMSGMFRDKNLVTKNGDFTFYFANTGRLMAKRMFSNGQLYGLSEFWYENGKRKDSGRLFYGKKVGTWKFWHENGTLAAEGKYADSLLIPQGLANRRNTVEKADAIKDFVDSYYDDVKINLWKFYHDNKHIKDSMSYTKEGLRQGFAKSWYRNGQLESIGYYNDDKEENEWSWYYENGKMATKETYQKGKVQALQCFDTTGKYIGDYCGLNKTAIFPGGESALNKYIKQYMKYPEESLSLKKNVLVKVSFIVNEDGLINKTMFEPTPNIYFNREVERLLFSMPKWDPAIKHNRVVAATMTLEILFIFPKSTKPS